MNHPINVTSYCESCGSLGRSCCDNASYKSHLSNDLARLVKRQWEVIKNLRSRLGETNPETLVGESDYKWGAHDSSR